MFAIMNKQSSKRPPVCLQRFMKLECHSPVLRTTKDSSRLFHLPRLSGTPVKKLSRVQTLTAFESTVTQRTNRTLTTKNQEIKSYFQTSPKPDIKSNLFEEQLFLMFWNKPLDKIKESPHLPEAADDSYEYKRLNDKSIHFSRLDESLPIEGKAVQSKASAQSSETVISNNCPNDTLLASVEALRRDVMKSSLDQRCRVKLINSLADMRKALMDQEKSRFKKSLRDATKCSFLTTKGSEKNQIR